MSGQPHRNFAVKNSLEQAPCAPQWCIGPSGRASRSALMQSGVLKATLITLTQPENFAFSSGRAAKPRNFRTAKLRCGWPDIVGDRSSAGMISDYCVFTMSSIFSATGQLHDVKRAGDRKLARL